MVPRPEEPAAATPDFTSRQGYLDPAPAGVDARFAWTIAGGRGARIRIVDCEHGWLFDHEDLLANNGGIVSGSNNASNDHGTAVFGILGGDRDTKGVTGIAADAWLAASSWTNQAAATAITEAADELRPGDFLLLEGQLGGPKHTNPNSDIGLIALEWWPDLFAAIRAAATGASSSLRQRATDSKTLTTLLVTSPWGIGILKQQGNTFSNPVIAANGTRFGGWLLNTADNRQGALADFDGDTRAEILVTSPWGIGLLEQAGRTLGNPVIKPNGTRFGQWLLNTADNEFGI
ncbi:hypothetical protein QFZ60_000750 [Arthrobacter sp. B2I5]|uniref:hypothetical protein n=1 Tax=Arthrobacter sp. B2I5 TaxID=3042266 RepID=UPI00278A0638|nr:hypothetical protein [Arthrobacter sp. B2I5]MDQ0824577.1 hypothetical protein [Arthrobacter sp. B2I5]